MTDQNDILRSARDIASNVDDLINDIENLEEHDHDVDFCRDCQKISEEADENHSHDMDCAGCEQIIRDVDSDTLMDYNYYLWQDIGEEAVREYQERTGEVTAALDELVQRVLGLYSTVDSTDVDDVTEAINYITEKVYGVREEPKPDIVEQVTVELPSVEAKCSCGVDHSVTNYDQI